MEIIKRGRLPEDITYTGNCGKCGSILKARQKELEIHNDQKDGPYGIAPCIVCSNTKVVFYIEDITY